ncbi:hypothetical protein [Thermomonas sp.]
MLLLAKSHGFRVATAIQRQDLKLRLRAVSGRHGHGDVIAGWRQRDFIDFRVFGEVLWRRALGHRNSGEQQAKRSHFGQVGRSHHGCLLSLESRNAMHADGISRRGYGNHLSV